MPTALLNRPAPFRSGISDAATRRQFLFGLGAAGLLTACGSRPADTPAQQVADRKPLIDDRGEVPLDGVPERFVTLYEEMTELVVALGLKPVGVSGRLDPTKGDQVLADYYLTPEQIGSPTFVGADTFDLEAIAALDPDLILNGFPEPATLPTLERIAPNAVYDVTQPGGWQEALRRLGTGVGREQQATATIEAYARDLAQARETLAPVVATVPRVTVLYPNYSGGGDTLVFGREFAFAAVLPELGFDLVGIEKSDSPTEPVGNISLELVPDIDTDTIIAVGPTEWTETPASVILSTLDVPVLSVLIRADWPSTGPLTSGVRLGRIVEALQLRAEG